MSYWISKENIVVEETRKSNSVDPDKTRWFTKISLMYSNYKITSDLSEDWPLTSGSSANPRTRDSSCQIRKQYIK